LRGEPRSTLKTNHIFPSRTPGAWVKGIKNTLSNAFKYLQKKTINGLIHSYFPYINLKKDILI